MSRTRSDVAVASSADTFAATLYLPAATVFGGRTCSFASFDWRGSSGSALSSWLPYCSVKVASKFCGACADKLATTFFGLSFLMASWNSKLDLDVPRSSGSCGLSVSLAGRSVASFTSMGSVALLVAPRAVTVKFVVPMGASLGTSRRSSSGTLALAARRAPLSGWPAHAQGRRPARGTPADRERQPLRRKPVVLQLEIDRRRGAGAQGDRGVISQKEQPFDVALGFFRHCCNAEAGEDRKHSRKQRDNTISHDDNSSQ